MRRALLTLFIIVLLVRVWIWFGESDLFERQAADNTAQRHSKKQLRINTNNKEIIMTILTSIKDARKAANYSEAGPEPNILFQNEQIKVIAAGLEAGQEIPEHPEALAVYYILEGKGQMQVDGEPIEVGPGASVVTPAGSTRGMVAETRLLFLATRIAASVPKPLASGIRRNRKEDAMYE